MQEILRIAFFILIAGKTFTLNGQVTIAEARAQALNTEVTIRGVITNGPELGIIRYIQDATAGLAIYSSAVADQLHRGDSVLVTGILVEYSGLLELNPVSNITPLGSALALPETQTVTPAGLNELLESEIVRLNGVIFGNGGSTFSANTSYGFSSGVQQSTIYVRTGSPLIGQLIPFGAVDLIGICSQFGSSYQVLPRDTSDFILQPGINIISTVEISNIQQNEVTLGWQTNIAGSTEVAYGLTPQLELGLISSSAPVIDHTFPLTGLQAGQVYYFQVFSAANGTVATGPVKVFGTVSNSLGWVRSYFNHPVDTINGNNLPELMQLQLLDDSLIAYINRSEESLDMTIYDFGDDEGNAIATAVNAAHNRGVRVRFISDGNQLALNSGVAALLPEVPQLLSPVGGNFTIMHNKFVVIDADHSDPKKPVVWTGSTNLTDRQVNRDPNNVIIVQDQTLARTYQLEFQEMWGSSGDAPDTVFSRFGSQKTDNTPHEFVIGGNRVECYFSPSDNTNEHLISTIETANDSLLFATMLITRIDIATAISDIIMSGVGARGYINDQATTTVYSDLLAAIGSSLEINPDTHVIMHHKYFVADAGTTSDPLVWTGSHNWSTNATTKNDENTLVVHSAEVADWYRRAFNRLVNPVPVDTTIGFNHVTNAFDLSVFPSVTNSLPDLNLQSGENGKAAIRIITQDGKLIYSGALTLQSPSTQKLSMLPAVENGIYFCTVRTSQSEKTFKILVIQ